MIYYVIAVSIEYVNMIQLYMNGLDLIWIIKESRDVSREKSKYTGLQKCCTHRKSMEFIWAFIRRFPKIFYMR